MDVVGLFGFELGLGEDAGVLVGHVLHFSAIFLKNVLNSLIEILLLVYFVLQKTYDSSLQQ